MIRRFLATKPKFGSSTAPPTVPVKGFFLILVENYGLIPRSKCGTYYTVDRNYRPFSVFLMNVMPLKWSIFVICRSNLSRPTQIFGPKSLGKRAFRFKKYFYVKIILEFPEFKTFEELHRWSLNNHEQFWARMSKSMISWDKEFTVTGKTTVGVPLVLLVKTARK